MANVYVSFNSGETYTNDTKTWNPVGASESGMALVDENNISVSGWTLDSSVSIQNDLTSGGISVTGDAAWFDESAAQKDAASLATKGTWSSVTLNVPTSSDTYVVELWGYTTSDSRFAEARVNGGASQTLNVSNNLSNTISFTGVTDNSGVILIEMTRAAADSYRAYFQGFRILDEVPVATLSIDVPLDPGQAFVLTYGNFQGVPTSPCTITDGLGNSITVAVTIADNGDGTGTASGTMPSLPGSGSAASILFGDVTVELSE
tara:strand:- start:2280 stop:3065 length:786 start_codon:yes stop_codon:yes gene_type:complete